MPQLDKLSWFPQIFWLLIVLFFLYFFFLTFFLPTVASTLKFRNKLLALLQGGGLVEPDVVLSFQKKYAVSLSLFVKTKSAVALLFHRRKLDFLEEYSLMLYRSNISKRANKIFFEGYRKLRVIMARSKKI